MSEDGQSADKGPSIESFLECESKLGLQLPQPLKRWLSHTDGWEGPVGDSDYVQLYSVNDITNTNAAYREACIKSKYLIFGSDGGGEAYAFIVGDTVGRVVMVPFLDIESDEYQVVADTFEEFAEMCGVPIR